MAEPPDIPDLDLGPRARTPSARPGGPSSPPDAPASDAFAVDGAFELERGGAEPSSTGTMAPRSGGPPLRAIAAASSGLDVGYSRTARRDDGDEGPTALTVAAARVVPLVACFGTAAGLLSVTRRPGGLHLLAYLEHALDASSTVQSGAFAVIALLLAVSIGYAGFRAPRSWALLLSAAMFLLAALAMVTVTLVSTDETPTQADGALAIPYLLPLAVLALGVGIAGRGRRRFLEGGAGYGVALALGAVGGLFVFLGIALTPFVPPF